MRIRILVALILLLLPVGMVRGGETADDVLFYKLVQRLDRDAKESDFALMLRAILSGSMMGQGDGWFKPSESRYDWKWLSERHETAKKDKITSEEFIGPPSLFARLDRDRNGVITRDDLDWSSKAQYWKQLNQSNQWLRLIDPNRDGKLTREEWDEIFKKFAQGKDHLDTDDVRALLNPPPVPMPFQMPDIPSKTILLKGLFSGELGSPCEGPKIGDAAPDFKLFTHDGKKSYSLSSYRGKPLVLIFGSFT